MCNLGICILQMTAQDQGPLLDASQVIPYVAQEVDIASTVLFSCTVWHANLTLMKKIPKFRLTQRL